MQNATLNEALNNPVILTNHHPVVLSGTPGPQYHSPPAPAVERGCVYLKNRWVGQPHWGCGRGRAS